MSPPIAARPQSDRQIWMGLLARADATGLAKLFPDLPDHSSLRPPQVGSVMVRGRIGGIGQPFNLGEMTVSRCSIKLVTGEVGHAHVQGRSKTHALRAAVIDALMQTDRADDLRAKVLAPLAKSEAAHRATRAAKAAATRVEFFTLVRGEDP
jgi:alpha-D-ribose 1-methylphosphonate 5-triphosphate synthase subunit PhnG